ncbi:hypothetical protein K402DRAFT_14426 [Aulographum hederae CBS 113979]|uniref:Uncharacterized protein n=1 Tax=Aulographum hederae CBS 113979 TaxID=1176131 RepID=A0A6G1H7R9_9PEZI|nr:hypothetical protein K402DRAFT_14426 [Aulographum hederae CBS 113979]
MLRLAIRREDASASHGTRTGRGRLARLRQTVSLFCLVSSYGSSLCAIFGAVLTASPSLYNTHCCRQRDWSRHFFSVTLSSGYINRKFGCRGKEQRHLTGKWNRIGGSKQNSLFHSHRPSIPNALGRYRA